MAYLKNLSITNKGLRYKLMIAFSLMTVIPLLACVYGLSPYLFPGFQTYADVSAIVFASIVISILGLIIAVSMIRSVVEIAADTRKIADGDYDRRVKFSGDDEIGMLGQSINEMTARIKSNLEDLKSYGQSMKNINVEIHKKVLALSSLLQIGDIISAGSTQIDSLLELAVGKAANLFDTGFGILYLPRESGGDYIAKIRYNTEDEKLASLVIKKSGHEVLDRTIQGKTSLKISASTKLSKDVEEFKKAYALKNFLAIPLRSDREIFGLLLVSNNLNDYEYTKDDIDLVAVFAKHIVIAIESDMLSKKNDELATRDELTGLFNKRYVTARLEEEIKRSIFYQRPCSFIMFSLDNFKNFRDTKGELASEEALRRIARILKDNTAPIGKAARMGGDEFAMLLPEKNKREAANIAEDVRKKIEVTNMLKDGKECLTISIGVSENPIDGATSEELIKKAMSAVEAAKALGKNRVV